MLSQGAADDMAGASTNGAPGSARARRYQARTQAAVEPSTDSSAVGGLLKKGLSWWRGQATTTGDTNSMMVDRNEDHDEPDEESAIEGSRVPSGVSSSLSRSRTMPQLSTPNPNLMSPVQPEPVPGANGTLYARSMAPPPSAGMFRALEGRTRHSTLDLEPRQSSPTRSSHAVAAASTSRNGRAGDTAMFHSSRPPGAYAGSSVASTSPPPRRAGSTTGSTHMREHSTSPFRSAPQRFSRPDVSTLPPASLSSHLQREVHGSHLNGARSQASRSASPARRPGPVPDIFRSTQNRASPTRWGLPNISPFQPSANLNLRGPSPLSHSARSSPQMRDLRLASPQLPPNRGLPPVAPYYPPSSRHYDDVGSAYSGYSRRGGGLFDDQPDKRQRVFAPSETSSSHQRAQFSTEYDELPKNPAEIILEKTAMLRSMISGPPLKVGRKPVRDLQY